MHFCSDGRILIPVSAIEKLVRPESIAGMRKLMEAGKKWLMADPEINQGRESEIASFEWGNKAPVKIEITLQRYLNEEMNHGQVDEFSINLRVSLKVRRKACYYAI